MATEKQQAPASPMRNTLDVLLAMGEERGVEKGRRTGLRDGALAGRRAMLRELLAERFGEVPADLLARVAAADEGILKRYASRLLQARDLRDVFATAAAAGDGA